MKNPIKHKESLEIPEHGEFGNFFATIAPVNIHLIRPKRLTMKEFLRLIEEIYSYRFENKVSPKASTKGSKKKAAELTGKELQEVTALFCINKFKTQKKKSDQLAFDFIASLE